MNRHLILYFFWLVKISNKVAPYFQFAFDATEMYYRVNDGAFGLLIPKKTEIIIWI